MPRKAPTISVGSPCQKKPVDPAAAAEFEAKIEDEGRGETPALHAVESPPERVSQLPEGSAEPRNRKGTVQAPYVRKSDGVPTVAVTFTVPAELARQVKVFAAMNDKKASEVGEAALEEYLERHS